MLEIRSLVLIHIRQFSTITSSTTTITTRLFNDFVKLRKEKGEPTMFSASHTPIRFATIYEQTSWMRYHKYLSNSNPRDLGQLLFTCIILTTQPTLVIMIIRYLCLSLYFYTCKNSIICDFGHQRADIIILKVP